MNRQCNTGVRCNSIQLGITTSGQVYQYQVIACQVSSVTYQVYLSNIQYQVIAYQVSGVRYQVSGGVYRTSPILNTYTYRITTSCVRQSTCYV